MATIKEHVKVTILVQTAVTPQATISQEIFFVEDAQVPPDLRYLAVTEADWNTVFNSGTEPYLFAQAFFSQELTADQLLVAYWAKTEVAPYWIAGASYETDFAVWELVADGSLRFNDGTNTDDITTIDFTGVTTLQQVVDVLNAELAALVGPSITNLENAEFSIDSQARIILTLASLAAGTNPITVEPVTPSSGTDLAAMLDYSNGTSFTGIAAEEPDEAVTALKELGVGFYNIAWDHTATADQQVALATFVETQTMQLDLVVVTADAINSGVSTDVGSRIQALSLTRTMIIYTEKTTEYPEAAVAGAVLPAPEGSKNFAYSKLSGVTESGNPDTLSTTKRNTLLGKGYVYIETLGGWTYLYDGLTATGDEKRLRQGFDWYETRVSEDIFTEQINQDLLAFDNETLAIIQEKLEGRLETAVQRRIFLNTEEEPFSITLPAASEFSASERATHKMTITNAFSGKAVSAANDFDITGNVTY
jgi:hypothetical protein